MTIDPRVALGSLTAALEEHLVAAASRRGGDDQTGQTDPLAPANCL